MYIPKIFTLGDSARSDLRRRGSGPKQNARYARVAILATVRFSGFASETA